MVRLAVAAASCLLAFAAGIGRAADAPAPPPASGAWTPERWVAEDTLELTTDVPDEGSYTFPVWLVVIDGQVYVRLGSRAADRVQHSRTAPLLGVTVGGRHFDHVRGEPVPDMAPRVAQAMGEKYTSDLLIHFLPHPLTLRLVPQQ